MQLTDTIINAALPGMKVLADGQRLALYRTGAGWNWRLKYRTAGGKDTMKSLGNYPAVSINKARAAAEDIRAKAASAVEQVPQPARPKASDITFGAVGEEYITSDIATKAAGTIIKRRWQFEKLSRLHSCPITSIEPQELLRLLEGIQAEGLSDGAHGTARLACAIFDHAQRHGIYYNPAARRKGWLKAYKREHHAAVVDLKGFGVLAALVDTWGSGTIANATRLLMRTCVRNGELRAAQWSELHDLDNPAAARWEIPAERMKMHRAHIVPLSRQAVAILEAQAKIAPRASHFVFPNARTPGLPINQSSIQCNLAAMGYDAAQHVPHGFRSSFSTLAREAGQDDAIIELCLAHADRNGVRAAYNRAERIDARRALMQWYSDYIERLKG